MSAYFHFGSEFLGLVDSPTVQPNRISCLGNNLTGVVNGSAVTLTRIDCKIPEDISAQADDGNVIKVSCAEQSIVQNFHVSEMAPDCNLQGCCRVTSDLMYAVDSRSNLVATRSSGDQWSYSYIAAERAPFSGGFAAVAPVSERAAATVHYLSKQLQWTDVDAAQGIRGSLALYNPTAVTAVSSSAAAGGTLAVAEGRSLSIWDHRMKENDGCAFRSPSGQSPLWTVLSKDNDVLTAGADRTVQVYDSRTWRMRLNWRSPCKYDIIRLLPAQGGRARGIYVCGLDNEVLLCDVTGVEKKPAVAKGVKRKADEDEAAEGGGGPCHAALPDSSKLRISHHRGVRAESCWAGIDVNAAAPSDSASGPMEQLIGICDGGKLYVVHNADKMKYAE